MTTGSSELWLRNRFLTTGSSCRGYETDLGDDRAEHAVLLRLWQQDPKNIVITTISWSDRYHYR